MSKVKSSEIIDALLDNLNEGAEEIYQMIAVPEIYWIYLHFDDFKEVERKSDKIVDGMGGLERVKWRQRSRTRRSDNASSEKADASRIGSGKPSPWRTIRFSDTRVKCRNTREWLVL
jgi:hypothetical protein